MNQRIELLESKLAFQEMTIEELNNTIIHLQEDMIKLKQQLIILSQKIQSSSNIASLSEETPPPHY